MGHKSKKNNHIRSRSNHIPQTQIKNNLNSRTPPPRNSIKNTASSPHLFPDIDHLNITPSDLEKIFDDEKMNFADDNVVDLQHLNATQEKKEEDEPLFFRPLSRSISFDS